MDPQASKSVLIENLKNGTYCRIKPSKFGGVGVFAVRSIPEGVDPFQTVYPENLTSVDLTPEEVKTLHPNVQRMVKDFFMRNEEGDYPIIHNGLNSMNLSYYLNHSDRPNIGMVDSGASYYSFRTSRRIKPGEELTIDYYQHCDTPEAKEFFGSQFDIPTK